MKIFSIDASFVRTVIVYNEVESVEKEIDDDIVNVIQSNSHQVTLLENKACEDNIIICIEQANLIAKQLREIILPHYKDPDLLIVVKYPIVATRQGTNLAVITAKLDSLFRALKLQNVVYLPSIAVSSYTKCRTQTELVKWFKEMDIIHKFTGSNSDIATAVLGEIGRLVHEGIYKKPYIKIDYLHNKIENKRLLTK